MSELPMPSTSTDPWRANGSTQRNELHPIQNGGVVLNDPTPYPKAYLYRRLVQSKLFIDEHFAEDIDVDCISDHAFFSKYHFIRQFKQIYGRTPHQYLSQVRIDRAKALLEQGNSVTETCFAVGFDSLGSFSGLFKRIVGLSPRTYRRQQLELRIEVSSAPLRFIPGCFAGNEPSTGNSNSQEADE